MDVHVVYNGVFFVWDSEKASANEKKHHISFDRAVSVFSDPLAKYEDASTPDESRSSITGRDLERKLLFVVHLIREDRRIRIISARLAEPKEIRSYEDAE
jgi:uncharacterized DUF497 family protein